MNQAELAQLMELARRRPLSEAERARLNALLEANPQAWPDRDDDMGLARLLATLPDAPLASNFTSRVMAAIEREEAATSGGRVRNWQPRRWFLRLAGAAAVAAVTATGWWQYRSWQRAEFAASLAAVSEVAAVPSVELLKDFEAIQSYAKVPPGIDVEGDLSLLAALQ
ncbi:MAG TPA: hypothetical protein DCY13_16735 [Verrucomicrobiales bacterium]|nr:hypothetical protein [Verrucomicrobiales bacterium]